MRTELQLDALAAAAAFGLLCLSVFLALARKAGPGICFALTLALLAYLVWSLLHLAAGATS